jgi:hypothetical protein
VEETNLGFCVDVAVVVQRCLFVSHDLRNRFIFRGFFFYFLQDCTDLPK